MKKLMFITKKNTLTPDRKPEPSLAMLIGFFYGGTYSLEFKSYTYFSGFILEFNSVVRLLVDDTSVDSETSVMTLLISRFIC